MTGRSGPGPGPSPYDTWPSGGLRFLVELIAWVAGPWAAGRWLGGWAIVPTAVILVGVPAVFSTPGDKEQVIVPTPGPVRLMLELDLGLVAAISAWFVWPPTAAILVLIIVVASPIAGWRRARWLLQGAPGVGA